MCTFSVLLLYGTDVNSSQVLQSSLLCILGSKIREVYIICLSVLNCYIFIMNCISSVSERQENCLFIHLFVHRKKKNKKNDVHMFVHAKKKENKSYFIVRAYILSLIIIEFRKTNKKQAASLMLIYNLF